MICLCVNFIWVCKVVKKKDNSIVVSFFFFFSLQTLKKKLHLPSFSVCVYMYVLTYVACSKNVEKKKCSIDPPFNSTLWNINYTGTTGMNEMKKRKL